MSYIITLNIEKLPEGYYLATSDEVQGLVAQAATINETIEIAKDIARKLLEAKAELSNLPTVKNNQVIIDLPKSFDNKRVEVIVLSADENAGVLITASHKTKQESLKRLLSVSEWDADDINNIIDGQKLFKQ